MGISDDLTAAEVIDRPHEYYGKIRETQPVYWNEKYGGWIVTRHDHVQECLRDNSHLSVEAKSDSFREGHMEAKDIISQWMVVRDQPDHTRLRRLAMDAFNTREVEKLRPDIEEITREKIDDIKNQADPIVDFINDFAYPVPLKTICRMLGVPEEKEADVKRWGSEIILVIQQHYEKPDRYERAEKSVREFASYLRELVQERKEDPQEDLISYLIQAESEEQMLDEGEIVATAMLFLVGGHETTSNLTANGILELLRHPKQWEKLQNDPSLASSAVEEILRYQSPLKAVTRGVVEDFELGGEQIQEGDKMLLSLVSANRDPSQFENPDRFDISRNPENHLAFGGGIHFCIGAPLARLEATVAIPAFVSAFPDAELATDEIEWERSAVGRGLKELNIRV